MENVKHESEHKRASQVARIVATKTQEKPEKGREAAAPSLIKEIQEGQGGKKHHTMVAQSSPKMPK